MTLILNLISHTGWMGSIDLHISRQTNYARYEKILKSKIVHLQKNLKIWF